MIKNNPALPRIEYPSTFFTTLELYRGVEMNPECYNTLGNDGNLGVSRVMSA